MAMFVSAALTDRMSTPAEILWSNWFWLLKEERGELMTGITTAVLHLSLSLSLLWHPDSCLQLCPSVCVSSKTRKEEDVTNTLPA